MKSKFPFFLNDTNNLKKLRNNQKRQISFEYWEKGGERKKVFMNFVRKIL